MRICLLFPPGWTLTAASPHLALPLLQSHLRSLGHDVIVRDLNLEAAEYYGAKIADSEALAACKSMTMAALNRVYFAAEDRLMGTAAHYGGQWNAQLGFEYDELTHCSSKDVFQASFMPSPSTRYYEDMVLPWLSKENPDVVGISVATVQQLIPSFQFLRRLRDKGFDGLVVMGGNTVTRLRDEIASLRWPFDLVDVFIPFQGETPISRLGKVVDKVTGLHEVPGAIWRLGDTVICNPLCSGPDLDVVPPPDFDGLPLGRYWGVNYLPIVGARGCYYGKCSFCSIPYAWNETGFAGSRNVELVFRDMLALYDRHGTGRFKLVDESAIPSMTLALSDRIRKTGAPFEWEIYARLERHWLDREFVESLARGGLRKAYFGLEILADGYRDALRKKDRASEIKRMLDNCADAGVKVHAFCMFGFPGTTHEDAKRTTDFVLENSNLIDTADINGYTYVKHTQVSGIRLIEREEQDWALEYEFIAEDGSTSTVMANQIARELEDIVWRGCHRLVHPTYRLVSPWGSVEAVSDSKEMLTPNLKR